MTICAPSVLLGSQTPRVSSYPAYVASSGDEAIELSASAGLHLDPWQQHVIRQALGERINGRWAAFEVGLVVPRQNGKGSLLEARELAGLFLLDEQLILHSAHEFKTAAEGFRRIMFLIENTPDLDRQVKKVTRSHGDEGVELKSGQRLRFVARTGGSGRGFSGDCVIFDEAYNLDGRAMGALLPTLSARPNPQLWYASSAGMESSEQLRNVRERALAGGDPGLCYMEWSADDGADLDDPESWALANPALGIRISEEFVSRERAALGEVEFGRERIGLWDKPGGLSVIDLETWESLTDSRSQALDPVSFAVEMTPDRAWASIGMAGRRADGLMHVEIVENRRGSDWLLERAVELHTKWNPAAFVVDPSSPAGSLLPDLAAKGIEVTRVSGREMTQACGAFYDAAMRTPSELRHLGQPPLNAAVDAGRKRPLGDAWAWHRKDATADISPLVAVTLALHGLRTAPAPAPAGRVYAFR